MVLVDGDVNRVAGSLIKKYGLAKAEAVVTRRIERLDLERDTTIAALWRQVLAAIGQVKQKTGAEAG